MNDSNQTIDRVRSRVSQVGLPADPPSADSASALDLGALWGTIKRSKWIIMGTAMLVTGLTVGITLMMPQIYESTALVSVEGPGTEAAPAMMGFGGQRDLRTEIGILENSGELARRVLASMRTAADTTEGVDFSLFAPTEGEEDASYAAMVRLHDMVSFRSDANQGLIAIRVESESPEEAALIANVYAQEYRGFSQEMARSGVAAARSFLEDQLAKRRGDIQTVENEWEAFARSNAVVTEGLDGQNVAREYAELQTQRDALTFQLEQDERTLAVLKNQMEQVEPGLRSTVLKEQTVQSLRTQIQALENQIAELKASSEQYYINDPTLRGNESRIRELADMKRRIDGYEARKVDLTEELVEASRAVNGVGVSAEDGASTSIGQLGTLRFRIQEQEQKVDQAKAQIAGLDERISSYQGRLATIPRQTIQREQLDRRLAQAEQFYSEIARELQRTIVTEESELGYVQVMRSAVVPMLPVSPDFEQNVILGLLLGLGLGVGFGFLYQSMNRYIFKPDDIQAKGYSLVGVIPKMDREIKKAFKGEAQVEIEGRMLSTRLFPLLNPWSPITENYRLVRANLQFASLKNQQEPTRGAQLMMISSPEPGDGKTTTAVNLAITIALSGRKVLLIDGDMRRPSAHALLGMERGPGLADILAGDRTMELVQKTIIDGLSFIPAGTPNVPPTELLDSERMRGLLARSAQNYDVVILDTPPILAATDPVVLAPYCDVVLVVASAEKTDFRALSQVDQTLNAVGVPVGGVIFNRYDAQKTGGGYKYGYGYNYTYDYTRSA